MASRVGWAVVMVGGLVSGCTLMQERDDAEIVVAKALVSDEQEAQLGEQIRRELEQQGIRYTKDVQVQQYVEGLVAQLQPHAKKDRDTRLHVHVIDDTKTVNAFATPGGHLYVYTGLLTTASNESEVVGVLSHEVGHVVARHAARSLVAQLGLSNVASLALGSDPEALHQVVGQLLTNGALLAHSRADELEADVYAVRYAAAAGYDPRGIAMFFRKLPTVEGRWGKALSWLQTHPTTPDRIERVNATIARERLSGSKLGAETLAPIKQRIEAGMPVSWK
ncbi:MAG: M48 family metalloprotease [Myxococcaceae bacterium]|nr:M48 family metalloprotease [Myxococcaceae bacterium]